MSGKIILINFCVIFKSWNIKGEIKGSEPSKRGERVEGGGKVESGARHRKKRR
jgi:hypothetical protein